MTMLSRGSLPLLLTASVASSTVAAPLSPPSETNEGRVLRQRQLPVAMQRERQPVNTEDRPCMSPDRFLMICRDYLMYDTDLDGRSTQNDFMQFFNDLPCLNSPNAIPDVKQRNDCFDHNPLTAKQAKDGTPLPRKVRDFHQLPLRLQLRYVIQVCSHVDDEDGDRNDCVENLYEAEMSKESFGFFIRSRTYDAKADIVKLCAESFDDVVAAGYIVPCDTEGEEGEDGEEPLPPRDTNETGQNGPTGRDPTQTDDTILLDDAFDPTANDGNDAGTGNTGTGSGSGSGSGSGTGSTPPRGGVGEGDFAVRQDDQQPTAGLRVGLLIGLIVGGLGLVMGCLLLALTRRRNDRGYSDSESIENSRRGSKRGSINSFGSRKTYEDEALNAQLRAKSAWDDELQQGENVRMIDQASGRSSEYEEDEEEYESDDESEDGSREEESEGDYSSRGSSAYVTEDGARSTRPMLI